jgi:hypothetical protein
VDRKVTEAEYVTEQAAQAKAAIGAVIGDMKAAIASSANLREWTRQYPWVVTASAAVAGFAAGMLVTPSKDESFREMWESIKDKFTPDLSAKPEVDARTVADQPAQGDKPSWFSVVLREVLKAVGPTIGGMLTGALASQPAEQEGAHTGNGHHPQPPPGGPPPTV